MKRMLTICVLIAIWNVSCYRDVEEELYGGGGGCDTTGVTYSAVVAPLLQSFGCVSCHSGGAPSGNISLDGYNAVRVVAQNGRLFGAINHSPGFAPMPQGGNKMNACQLARIKAWIDAGATNN